MRSVSWLGPLSTTYCRSGAVDRRGPPDSRPAGIGAESCPAGKRRLADRRTAANLVQMYHVFALAVVTMSGTEATPTKAVSDAQAKCVEVEKGSGPSRFLPVQTFDLCIVGEANKWPIEIRMAICALSKSGGPYRSTLEVYMANGRCRADAE